MSPSRERSAFAIELTACWDGKSGGLIILQLLGTARRLLKFKAYVDCKHLAAITSATYTRT